MPKRPTLPPGVTMEDGERLLQLFNHPAWPSLAKLVEMLAKEWAGRMTKINIGDSCETIAKTQIKWASQVIGLQTLFIEMNKIMETIKELENDDGE